jgi:tetratricopeptide (TPR) repeat protein
LSGSLSFCLFAQTADQAALERYYGEGEKALAERRYAEAATAFEKLLQLDPRIAEVHARLGLVYFQQGQFVKAVPALRQAQKLKPGLPNIDVLLAMSLSGAGEYKEALPGLEKGFRQSADQALKRMSGLQLQRAYTGLGRDAEAVEVALALSRLYADDPEVLYHASRLFANYAYLTLQQLSRAAPESLWRRLAAAEAHESQGNQELAIAAYREVLRLDPGRPGIHYRLGRVLLRAQERQEEALKEFEQELAIDPTNANAAYEAGEIHRRANRLDKAAQLFGAAIAHDAAFEEARIGLGKVLIAQGKPEAALEHLRRAVTLNARNEVAHYLLSRVHRALGNTAEQQKEMAEFQRLRNLRERQENLLLQEVTPQRIDDGDP